MKLTLVQIVSGYQALENIGTEKMPIKLAYIFQRNMRTLQPDFKDYEQKRTELIKTKYGVEQENGNWIVPQEKKKKFTTELETLGELELELDIRTIDLSNVNMNIAPNDLFILEWMFIEEPETLVPTPKVSRKRHG